MPAELVSLDLDEPVTDERLLELNPEWKSVLDQRKREILGAAVRECFHADRYYNNRCIMALAVSIGADQNLGVDGRSALSVALEKQDFFLAKYFFAKGVEINNHSLEFAFENVKSVKLTELLIEHGMKLPKYLWYVLCRKDRPVELLQFYLAQGIKAAPANDNRETTILRHLFTQKPYEGQIAKARLLLTTDVNIAHKDWDRETVLHAAAGYLQRRKDLCMVTIDHYLDQHRAFLGFLWYLKNNFLDFYRMRDLKKLCFKELSPVRKLRDLLSIKNNNGKTAHDLLPIDELDPTTCTYQKFMNLKNSAQI